VPSSLLPDWAPNIHPLLVHFPIALLTTAVLVDLVGLALGGNRWIRNAATLMCLLGTLTALAAYATGRAASQTVRLPGMAHAVVSAHWDWAFRTVWFFGPLSVLRLVLVWPGRTGPARARVAALALAGLVGVGLLYETGDRGARLVYEHGVGTTAAADR